MKTFKLVAKPGIIKLVEEPLKLLFFNFQASGGNDNKLFIWNLSNSGSSHSAAAIPQLTAAEQVPIFTIIRCAFI